MPPEPVIPRPPWEMDQAVTRIQQEIQLAKEKILSLDVRSVQILDLIGEDRQAIATLSDVELFAMQKQLDTINEFLTGVEGRLQVAESENQQANTNIGILDANIPTAYMGRKSFNAPGEYAIPFQTFDGKPISMVDPSVSAEYIGGLNKPIDIKLETFSADVKRKTAAVWAEIQADVIGAIGAGEWSKVLQDPTTIEAVLGRALNFNIDSISPSGLKKAISFFGAVPISQFTFNIPKPSLNMGAVPEALNSLGSDIKNGIRANVYNAIDGFVENAVEFTWTNNAAVPDDWLKRRVKKFLKHSYKSLVSRLEQQIQIGLDKAGTEVNSFLGKIQGKVESFGKTILTNTSKQLDTLWVDFQQQVMIKNFATPLHEGLLGCDSGFSSAVTQLGKLGNFDWSGWQNQLLQAQAINVSNGLTKFGNDIRGKIDDAMKANFEIFRGKTNINIEGLTAKFNKSGIEGFSGINQEFSDITVGVNEQMDLMYKQMTALLNIKVDAPPGFGMQQGIVKEIGNDNFIVKLPEAGTVAFMVFGKPVTKTIRGDYAKPGST